LTYLPPSALVVGAGPVGLAAALELDRLGAAVRLIDQSSDRPALSKAVGVNARALELLEPSGVTHKLLDAGLKVSVVNLRFGTEVLAAIDFSKMQHRHNYLLCLPQSDTERIMVDALAERGITVERATELTEFEQDDAGIAAMLSAQGSASRHLADYLLGCDGAHSSVRGALGLGFGGERYPDSWSLADIRMDWAFGHGEGNLIMRPEGQVLFVISLPGDRFRAISNTENVLDLLPEGASVTEILWQTSFPVSLRHVTSYGSGRVFLAGDAAHIHSPAGGRGMNLGIEDATILAWRMVRGGLETYSRDRHRVGAQVVRESDAQFRMAAIRNPALRPVRDFLVRHVLGSEVVQKNH